MAKKQIQPAIYPAGPLGFSEAGRHFYNGVIIPDLKRIGYLVLDPWSIPESQVAFAKALAEPYSLEQCRLLQVANRVAGEANECAIGMSHLVLAILDGTDVDSGTASEIGFAAGINRPIVGYRGDFRLAADNIGSVVNLQVEHFIRRQGGSIFSTWAETREVLEARYNAYQAGAPLRPWNQKRKRAAR